MNDPDIFLQAPALQAGSVQASPLEWASNLQKIKSEKPREDGCERQFKERGSVG